MNRHRHASNAPRLYVNEIFGPTIQGEGPSAGRPAVFLRLAGCNLACSWCDTRYAWDFRSFPRSEEVHLRDVDQVADELRPLLAHAGSNLVVTGGEPMLQQEGLIALLGQLSTWVEIETAGTLEPALDFDLLVDRYVVSIKLAHSGNLESSRLRPDAIRALSATGRAAWKFVAAETSDLKEIASVIECFELRGHVWVMPEGTTIDLLLEHARQLVPEIIERGWFLSPRLQVGLWGTERKR